MSAGSAFDVAINSPEKSKAAPPKRLTDQSSPTRVSSTAQIDRAQELASANRQRLVDQQRTRCNEYVSRVKRTVRTSKEDMLLAAEARRTELEASFTEAEKRRQMFLQAQRQRINSYHQAPAPTEHQDQEALPIEKRQLTAERRREQYLAERSMKAAILRSKVLTPPAAAAPVTVTVPSPESDGQTVNQGPRIAEQKSVILRVQRLVRLAKFRELFHEAKLDRLPTLSFDEMTSVIATVSARRSAFHFLCAVDYRAAGDRHLPRVLLTAFVVAYHPQHAVSHSWMEQWSLVRWARVLVLLLSKPCSNLALLRNAWLTWQQKFQAWRVVDLQNMKTALIEDALATENLRHSLKSRATSDEERATLKTEVDVRQEQLRHSMRRLSGENGVRQLGHALETQKSNADRQLAHDLMIDLDGMLKPAHQVEEHVWTKLSADVMTDEWHGLNNVVVQIQSSLQSLLRSSEFDLSPFFCKDASLSQLCHGVDEFANALKVVHAAAYDRELELWTETTKAMIQNRQIDIVEAVRRCLHRLEEVRTQVARSRIRLLVPTVQDHGKLSERQAIESAIANGRIERGLPRTVAWLRHSYNKCPDLQQRVMRGQSKAIESLVCHGLVDIISMSIPAHSSTTSELLELDVDRLVRFQNDIQRMTILSSLSAVGNQFLSLNGCRSHPGLDLSRVRIVLEGNTFSPLEETQNEFIKALRSIADFSFTNSCVSQASGLVTRVCRAEDPTYRVLNSRLLKFIREDIVSGSRVATNVLDGQGLGVVTDEFRDICRLLDRIAKHMLAVHGQTVLKVARNLGDVR